MGCVPSITYDHYPEQAGEHRVIQTVGKRVRVSYHYDTSKCHYGVIVRDDIEKPYETIIALDNGRYLRGAECQYTLL